MLPAGLFPTNHPGFSAEQYDVFAFCCGNDILPDEPKNDGLPGREAFCI